jgi:hypothetical protein
MEPQTQEIELAALSMGDSPRFAGEDPDHVVALAESQNSLPPIIVHRGTMRIIDGHHRLKAAQARGQEKIEVRFFDGAEADAFVLSVESNVAHGLPLTMAERKRAASRIISSHPHWSDRMIASVTGISAGTVADIRRHLPGAGRQQVRIGQDGRARPVSGVEGRRRAIRLIAENPDLSLRQIARAAGISPETARDVRNRLRRGDDPMPLPRGAETVVRGTADREGLDLGRERSASSPRATATVVIRDRTAVVERLKVDPALRFTESGRALLRLLAVNTMSAEMWDRILDNVPPHCKGIVADLAADCARVWSELAVQLKHDLAETG